MRRATGLVRPAIVLLAALPGQAAPACRVEAIAAYQPRTFFGYDCESDCRLEMAGFDWAERHGITDPDACIAAGRPLEMGCRAFAQQGESASEAGYDWALENEVTEPSLCDGGGHGFRLGCLRYVHELPHARSAGCAEAWPERGEPFPPAEPDR